MPIGGAEDKIGRMTILREVVRLAGGSARRDRGDLHRVLARRRDHPRLPAAVRRARRRRRRRHPARRAGRRQPMPALVDAVDRATAVFMTGGNQIKLAGIAGRHPARRRRSARAHARGALVAGTSAGASICSAHMVSFGSGGATPKFRVGQVSQGLGLLRRRHRRPALHPAEPVRPAAGADRRQPGAARHRHRRGHRGDHPAGRPDGGQGPRRGDDRRRFGRDHHRLHRHRHAAADDVRDQAAHAAARRGVRPREPRLVSAPGLPDAAAGPRVATVADVPAGTRPRSRRIAAEGAHETTAELRRRPAASS